MKKKLGVQLVALVLTWVLVLWLYGWLWQSAPTSATLACQQANETCVTAREAGY